MTTQAAPVSGDRPLRLISKFWLAWLMLLTPGLLQAAAPLKIVQAHWSAQHQQLTVTGHCPGGMPNMPIELYDTSGRWLATGTANEQYLNRPAASFAKSNLN